MAKNAVELREELNKLVTEQRSALTPYEGKDAIPADVKEAFEKREARMSSIENIDLPLAEREERAKKSTEQQEFEEKRGKDDNQQTSSLHEKAFDAYVRGVKVDNMKPELRANLTTSDDKGGYLVPETFSTKVIELEKTYGELLQYVETMQTSTGEKVFMPTLDDTTSEASLLGEDTDADEVDLTFGEFEISSYDYTSGIFRISNKLIRDSRVDVVAMIQKSIAARFGRKKMKDATVGTGSSQPQGIITYLNATAGQRVAGAATAITFDKLLDLMDVLDSAYQTNGRFMLNKTTLKDLRVLKDSQGRYIWQGPDARTAAPALIFDKPYVINNYMANIGANALSVVFGDLNAGYLSRPVGTVSLKRFEEKYGAKNQIGFVAFQSWDSKVQQGKALAGLKHAAS
jgi:HK97 family phage major capsid protein